jgi:hypothetical protein
LCIYFSILFFIFSFFAYPSRNSLSITWFSGTIDDKIHFVFSMYDVSHDNTVSKQDLTTLLNQIPKNTAGFDNYSVNNMDHSPAPQHHLDGAGGTGVRARSNSNSTASVASDSHAASSELGYDGGAGSSHSTAGAMDRAEGGTSAAAAAAPATVGNGGGMTPSGAAAAAAAAAQPNPNDFDYEDVDFYTNHDMVERAFAECDVNHEGRLTYEEFKMWVQRTPVVMDYIESILPYNGPKDLGQRHTKKDSLPHLRRIASRMSTGGIAGRPPQMQDLQSGDIFNNPGLHHGGGSSKNLTRNSMRLTPKASQYNMQHLSLNLGGGGSTGPHSPAPTSQFPPTPHSNHAAGTGGGGGGGGAHAPIGAPLSRSSSFGFAGSSAHGGTPAGLGTDGPLTCGSNMPGEYTLTRMQSPTALHANGGAGGAVGDDHFEYESEEMARTYLLQAMEVTQNESLRASIGALLEDTWGGTITANRLDSAEVYRSVVAMEDYLWKKGKSMFHMLNKRYYLLSGNCLYYYTHKSDVRPKGKERRR